MAHDNSIHRSIAVKREVLYAGTIGKNRESFCIKYIELKRSKLKEIKTHQSKFVEQRNLSISCHKGCYFCCNEFIKTSLQECEAIAYYLFQNEPILLKFLNNFDNWYKETQKHPRILQALREAEEKAIDAEWNEKTIEEIKKAAMAYAKLNIYCPFLYDNSCLIYDIQPWVCAAQIATTPAEWCSPLSLNTPAIHLVQTTILEPDLYDRRLNDAYRIQFLPYTVMGIINKSIFYYRDVPELKFLTDEQASDQEVRGIMAKYKQSQ